MTSKNSDGEQRRATPNNARRRSSATQTATQDTPAQRSPGTGHAAQWQPCNARLTGPIEHGSVVTQTASTSSELPVRQPAVVPTRAALADVRTSDSDERSMPPAERFDAWSMSRMLARWHSCSSRAAPIHDGIAVRRSER